MRRCTRRIVTFGVGCGFGLSTLPATPAAAAEPPAAPNSAAAADRDAQVTKLLDFLEKEYATLLTKQKDRVSRSLLAISLSRIPRNGTTKTLLEMVKKESDPLVRAVAWECLLARMPMLTQDQYGQVMTATHALYDGGVIRGHLRVAALDLLGVSTPDATNKALWGKIYGQTDTRLAADDDVIDALGACLAAWRSPDMAEYLVGRMGALDEAFRAHRILAAAGAPVTGDQLKFDAGDAECLRGMTTAYGKWWESDKVNWKEARVSLEDAPWRKLGHHLVAPPPPLAGVDPKDKSWYRDLELRPPQLKGFDVGLVLDVTGSMGPALAWLRADARKLMAGVGVTCYEPRVALTFYRDHGDAFVTQHQALTGNVNVLLDALAKMDVKGGGDDPEAVWEALSESINGNRWASGANTRKAVVLVADAPPQPATQAQCEKLMADSAAKGFRLYEVKVHGPHEAADTTGLDALVRAAKGTALEAHAQELTDAQLRRNARQCVLRAGYGPSWSMPRPARNGAAGPALASATSSNLTGGLRLGGAGGGGAATDYDRRADPAQRAPGQPFEPAPGPTGRRVLSALLVDAINPQYADRVEPMVAVLWEMLQEPSTEKQQPFKPVDKVAMERGEKGMKPKEPKTPPKGVQDR